MKARHIRTISQLLLSLLVSFCAVNANALQENILKEYKSLYRNITVVEKNQWRCVRLKNKRNPFNSQSCMRMDKPQELLFFYSKAMMSVLATLPDGAKILSVGLGGGTMPTAIHSYFKKADVTTVELDPKMLEAAEEFMSFKTAKNNQVVTQDARFFIRKQKAKKAQYDVILLDAFNGEYIPEHLTTQEFLQEVKALLKPGGLLLSNTFSYKDFFHSESVTYDSVFPDFCSMRSATARTIVAYKGQACSAEALKASVEKILPSLDPYVANASFILRSITDEKYWDQDARIFTDQYSPANLLNK